MNIISQRLREDASRLREDASTVKGVPVSQNMKLGADLIESLQSELASLRQQLKEREESIKELLPLADMHRINYLLWFKMTKEAEEAKQIIDRAKALLSKQ